MNKVSDDVLKAHSLGTFIFPVLILVSKYCYPNVNLPGFTLHHQIDVICGLAGTLELKYLSILEDMEEILEIRSDIYSKETYEQ